MTVENETAELAAIDLRTLVGHAHAADLLATVESVHALMAQLDVDFVAVVGDGRFHGVCARRELAAALGSRYGFALNARRPALDYVMKHPLVVGVGTGITAVFKAIATRGPREFHDDVVLLEGARFVGMIPIRSLVTLQTEHLMHSLERVEAVRREIEQRNRQVEDDLRMAHEVQLAMLSQSAGPFVVEGRCLQLAQRYRPAGGVGGDFFHVLPVTADRVGLLVCDVMGHGVRSALITAMVRALLEALRGVAADPGTLMTRLNADLTRMLRQAGGFVFVTAAYAMIDVANGQLSYAQAGHPTPLRWNALKGECRELVLTDEHAGPALGLIDDFVFTSRTEKFGVGDRLLLFTDGLSEAANTVGEEFGARRLRNALARRVTLPLPHWLDGTVAEVAEFSGAPFADDVCLLAAELQ